LISQFLKPTSHILTAKDTLVAEEIDADLFRRAPAVWVGAIWERLRTVCEEDVGHSNEQFEWVMQHILGKLHPRFNTQKIEDDFRSQWCLDPTSVPERVGAIIAMNIQQIEMSGASGDPARDLLPNATTLGRRLWLQLQLHWRQLTLRSLIPIPTTTTTIRKDAARQLHVLAAAPSDLHPGRFVNFAKEGFILRKIARRNVEFYKTTVVSLGGPRSLLVCLFSTILNKQIS
jgi:hypothetical protein